MLAAREFWFPAREILSASLIPFCVPLADLVFVLDPLSDSIPMHSGFALIGASIGVIVVVVLIFVYAVVPRWWLIMIIGVISFTIFSSVQA